MPTLNKLGMVQCIYQGVNKIVFLSLKIAFALAYSVDPDEMPSVDPDEMPRVDHFIWVFTVCQSTRFGFRSHLYEDVSYQASGKNSKATKS